MHALLPEEIAAILDIAERWGTVDRSHRKLAHRGSYQGIVWVSPSSFRRVLVEHGLSLPEPAPRTRSEKRPWPDWLVWAPNRIWIWDATHFTRARRVCFAIVDLVSRKWIDTLVSVEETATQVTVLFEHALQLEGLLELLTDERLDLDLDDPRRPILLAVSEPRKVSLPVGGGVGHRLVDHPEQEAVGPRDKLCGEIPRHVERSRPGNRPTDRLVVGPPLGGMDGCNQKQAGEEEHAQIAFLERLVIRHLASNSQGQAMMRRGRTVSSPTAGLPVRPTLLHRARQITPHAHSEAHVDGFCVTSYKPGS